MDAYFHPKSNHWCNCIPMSWSEFIHPCKKNWASVVLSRIMWLIYPLGVADHRIWRIRCIYVHVSMVIRNGVRVFLAFDLERIQVSCETKECLCVLCGDTWGAGCLTKGVGVIGSRHAIWSHVAVMSWPRDINNVCNGVIRTCSH